MAKHQPPSIQVVLDTNCLFTEAADKLICGDVSNFILNDSRHLGLRATWHLPSVVKAERKYQMIERGKKLLPALVKIENLLGHALGINEDVLASRVDDAIRRQIDQHQLHELDMEIEKIDWRRVINSAANRLPPFDSGEKEKGFRDALILEAFAQLTDATSKSGASARIILLSSDKLLQIAAEERFKDRQNVLIAKGLDELRTILNAVASQLSQEAIDSILPRATELFFSDNENKETLYYKSNVFQEINRQFQSEYEQLPESGFRVSVNNINIGLPTFLAKAKQRLSLSSKIVFILEANKFVPRKSPGLAQPPMGLLSLIGAMPTLSSTQGAQGDLLTLSRVTFSNNLKR